MSIHKFNNSLVSILVEDLNANDVSIVAEQVEEAHNQTRIVIFDSWNIGDH
jgi:hypothetical protein